MRWSATATACARCGPTGARGARVGITDNCDVCIPVTETPADIAAAKAWFVEKNLHILDPIHRGGYSKEYLKRVGKDAPGRRGRAISS